uniref:Uncharacterized protein n=1 Tax=Anopheles atroparvus TaxID=41427 RepID=A0A182ITT5_ANOAO
MVSVIARAAIEPGFFDFMIFPLPFILASAVSPATTPTFHLPARSHSRCHFNFISKRYHRLIRRQLSAHRLPTRKHVKVFCCLSMWRFEFCFRDLSTAVFRCRQPPSAAATASLALSRKVDYAIAPSRVALLDRWTNGWCSCRRSKLLVRMGRASAQRDIFEHSGMMHHSKTALRIGNLRLRYVLSFRRTGAVDNLLPDTLWFFFAIA